MQAAWSVLKTETVVNVGMNVLRSKFRGCLLGALFGDALGAKFEGEYWDVGVPLQRFDELSKEELCTVKELPYTDDTAMTKAICRSFLSNKAFNVMDLAKRFVDEYFAEPRRGYGSGVVTVFQRLRSENYENLLLPAQEQFGGSGSYGNGAAMRVAPFALFYHNDFENLQKNSKQSALITHAHVLGIHGAILQAVAVYEALNTVPGSLDIGQYIDKMINTAQALENHREESDKKEKVNQCDGDKDEDNHEEMTSYVTQFQHIKRMLSSIETKPELDEVIKTLGHGIKAVEAVPAAIFSFLFKADTCLKDAIFYAISLGGDTDTIGSMTGAIAGAYWGDQDIPEEWSLVVESVDEVIQFANELYDLRVKEELD